VATKERKQNPVVGDTITLRMLAFNSNNFSDVSSIEKVQIYFLDPDNRSAENPDGRRLVEEFDGSVVESSETGKYSLALATESPLYTIGSYIDVWLVSVVADEPQAAWTQCFEIYPSLWYLTPGPVVYDFDFHFQPNKLRKGSKQYIKIEIAPRVPTASDLQKYYENLAITSNLKVSIEQMCGPCTPQEEDLRLVVDEEDVEQRDKRWGFYLLDTEDFDKGTYNIWFRLELGETVHVSPKYQLQIF
jgi:hypothetical protein